MRDLARKLVWWIDGAEGKSVAALADDAGELCSTLPATGALDGATVRLWHRWMPMSPRSRTGATAGGAAGDPTFAQVWREVYALTDAERATATYTNVGPRIFSSSTRP